MKKIALLLVTSLITSSSLPAYAQASELASNLDLDFTLDSASTPKSQCIDLFRQYKNQQIMKAFLVPPIGVPSTAALTFGAVVIGAYSGVAVGGGNTFGGLITGYVYAALFGGITFIVAGGVVLYLETDAIVRLSQASKVKKIIEQSYLVAADQNQLDVRKFERFVSKLYQDHPALAQKTTPKDIANQIVKYDQSGELCNGTLKKRKRHSNKLKHLLVKPTELAKAINLAF